MEASQTRLTVVIAVAVALTLSEEATGMRWHTCRVVNGLCAKREHSNENDRFDTALL
jgi:hypothetical protein